MKCERTPVNSWRIVPRGSRIPCTMPGSDCTRGSVNGRGNAGDERVGQRARNLNADGAEDDTADPFLRLRNAGRIDGHDLVHECDQEGEGADAGEQALRDENPVVDERLELSHGRTTSDARVFGFGRPSGRSG